MTTKLEPRKLLIRTSFYKAVVFDLSPELIEVIKGIKNTIVTLPPISSAYGVSRLTLTHWSWGHTPWNFDCEPTVFTKMFPHLNGSLPIQLFPENFTDEQMVDIFKKNLPTIHDRQMYGTGSRDLTIVYENGKLLFIDGARSGADNGIWLQRTDVTPLLELIEQL